MLKRLRLEIFQVLHDTIKKRKDIFGALDLLIPIIKREIANYCLIGYLIGVLFSTVLYIIFNYLTK